MSNRPSFFKCIKAFLSNAINPYRVFIALMIAVSIWLIPMLRATPVAAQEEECCALSAYCGYGPPSNRCCVAWKACNEIPPTEPPPTEPPPTDPPPTPTQPPPTQTPIPQPPLIAGLLNCSQPGNNGWCIGDLLLDLTAIDPQGKSIIISGSLNGNSFACPSGDTSCSVPIAEGSGMVTYLVNSATGLTAGGSHSYQRDNSSPQINGSLNGSNGANGWYISNVSLSASASDSISGLSTLEYSLDGDVWTNYISSLALSDGTHTIDLRAVDHAGNRSEMSQTINIDTVTPTLDLSITGNLGNNGWYKSNVQITATANDSGSRLAGFEYNLDGGGWVAYVEALTLADGGHDLSVRAMDAAGNVTQTDQQINVDTTNPLINLSVNGIRGAGGWYISDIQVNASSSDNRAGLASFEYSTNEGIWTPYTGAIPYTEGQHSLKFRATDNAGNVTTTPTQTYRVDTTLPFIDMPSVSKLGRTIHYNVQDHGSQLAVLKIVIEDANQKFEKIAWEEYPSGPTFSSEFLWDGNFQGVSAPEGIYFATIKASDLAGNESSMTGSITVENELVRIILPPFVPPVYSSVPPVNTPNPSLVAPEESISFGGEENSNPSDPETSNPSSPETGIVSVGGSATTATGSTETEGFASQNSSDSQSANLPNSNIIWGAAATAAVGAFIAEAERRRREEEEAERKRQEALEAERRRQAALEEQRKRQETKYVSQDDDGGGNTYRDKIHAKKKNAINEEGRRKKAAEQARLDIRRGEWSGDQQKVNDWQRQQSEEDHRRGERDGDKEKVEAWERQQRERSQQDFRAGERDGDREKVEAWNKQQAAVVPTKEKPWWEKTVDWIDNHQTAIALGIGIAVGIGAVILTAGAATPLVIAGAAAFAAGTISLGTIGLNAHYDRPLGTNIIKNIFVGASAAAATAFIVGGGLQLALIKLGNSVAVCMSHPTGCGRIEWALNAIDKLEEGSLIVKGAIQTWTGDSQGAADTANELQTEYMDGGMPGNTVAKKISDLGEDALEIALRYGDDAIPLMLKYGDDAVDIIGAYGDDGIKLLTAHGDDAVDLIKKYGTPAVELMRVVNPISADTLLKTLDDDVLEYAMAQGDDAVAALSRWSSDELSEHGPELALRAKKDAKVLKSVKELLNSGPIDPKNLTKEQQALIDVIAENSTQYKDGGQIVLGKWTDLSSGFAGHANDTGSVSYQPHPDMYNLLGQLDENRDEVAWLVNKQVIQKGIDKGLPFEYTLNGVSVNNVTREQSAIEAIFNSATDTEIMKILKSDYVPVRMKELQELEKAGYKYSFDELTKSYILISP